MKKKNRARIDHFPRHVYGCLSQELQAAAPYYEGKVITIIVGYSPGGGYDRI